MPRARGNLQSTARLNRPVFVANNFQNLASVIPRRILPGFHGLSRRLKLRVHMRVITKRRILCFPTPTQRRPR